MQPESTEIENEPRPKRLSMNTLWRIIRLVLVHRTFIIGGIVASLFYAMLHSVSILGALPILKVLLEDEGLHGWLDRAGAQSRLHAVFHIRETVTPAQAAVQGIDDTTTSNNNSVTPAQAGAQRIADTTASHELVVLRIDRDSALYQTGLRENDIILTLDQRTTAPSDWLHQVAHHPAAEFITFTAKRSGQPVGETQVYTAPLDSPSLLWRVGSSLATWAPTQNSTDARITTLTYVLTFVVFIVVLANLCRFLAEYCIGRAVLRAMMDLRRALYAKVLKLPMSRFTRNVGDLVTRFIQDIQDVQRGSMSLFGKSLREPLKALFILIAALILDWRITLTMVAVAPWALLIFWKVGTSIKKANRKLLRGYGYMIDTLHQTLGAIGIVKAYTTENAERLRLLHLDRRMFRQQLKIVKLDAVLSPALETLGVMAVSVVTVWLGRRVLNREIDVSTFGTLVIALGMLFDPLRKMADVYARLLRSAAGAERLCETLDSQDETEIHSGTVDLQPIQSQIEFRDVTFTYPETDSPALDNVNLIVKRGETVALVGPNGSGKTTLVNLMTRFYDPQFGAVLIDGVDLRTVTLRSLRRQIGLVTQDSIVFPITLADNISYGTRNGSRDAVIHAARQAYADEFIRTKPQGYDTIPGDMGKTLSGGQKQRLAIARAIFRDAPILIFDEATSQIDTESEQKIQSALREFARQRTTFIIAHRLSTITFADRIVVLDAGKIVDTGTHEELLTRCPLYHGLCETQLIA